MKQKLLKLAKKLGNFTPDDLAMLLETNSENIQKNLEELVLTGNIEKKDANSYCYLVENLPEKSKNSYSKENKYYNGIVFTDDELEKFDDEMQTSELFLKAHWSVQKKIKKYVALSKAANGIFGNGLDYFIQNEWNKKYPEMKSSKGVFLKNKRLLKTHGIEALVPLAGWHPKQSTSVSEKLFSEFKKYLIKNNKGKTLKTCYTEFKKKYLLQNKVLKEYEFPSFAAVTRKIQADISDFGNKDFAEFYQQRNEVPQKIAVVKKSGFTDFKSAAEDFWECLKNEKRLKKASLKKYNFVPKHLIPFFQGYKLQEIKADLIEKFIKQKTQEQLSQKNILGQIQMLRRILAIYSPVEVPFSAQITKIQTVNNLEKKEIKKIFNSAKSKFPDIYPIILTAILTGMTTAEIFALSWDKIDFPNNRIIVNSSVKDKKVSTYLISNAIREILVPTFLLDELLKIKNSSHFIFQSKSNGIQDPEKFVRFHLKPFIRKANLKNFDFEDLRDTYVFLMLGQNIPLTFIQQQLGISSIKAFVEKYKPLIDKQNPERIALDENIFRV